MIRLTFLFSNFIKKRVVLEVHSMHHESSMKLGRLNINFVFLESFDYNVIRSEQEAFATNLFDRYVQHDKELLGSPLIQREILLHLAASLGQTQFKSELPARSGTGDKQLRMDVVFVCNWKIMFVAESNL